MPRRRISAIAIVIILAFAAIAGRLCWLQGVQYQDYRIREQSRRMSVRFLPAERGRIITRGGEILAQDVPRHALAYNLTEIEQCRRVSARLAGLIHAWGRKTPEGLTEDSIFDSLEELRATVRPWLGGEEPVALCPWARNLDLDLTRYLRVRIGRRPERYPGLHVELTDDSGTIWVDPDGLFAGEAATRRVEQALGLAPGTLYHGRDGQGGVWGRYLAARSEPNRRRRQDRFDLERVLVRDIPFELAVEICYEPDLYPGLHLREAHARNYPGGKELAHVIGLAGPITAERFTELADAGTFLDHRTGLEDPRVFRAVRRGRFLTADWIGRSGLERSMDGILRGTPGARFIEIDGNGREIGEPRAVVPPVDGDDVLLTVDLPFSARIRQLLVERGVQAGSVLVGEPETGEILAWVSHPSFDPQHLSRDYPELAEQEHLAPLLDRPSRFALPPGSVIKTAVALAGLESGVITADTEYVCEGLYNPRQPDRLRCRNHPLPLTVRVTEALAWSCNCFFYDLAEAKLGVHGFWNQMTSLGFGNPTGAPVYEERGLLPIRHHELASAAIGQGRMLATPLQLFRLMCLLANRGTIPSVRLIQDDSWTPAPKLPVSESSIQTVVEGMRQSVVYGTAHKPEVGLYPYDCAVKTGTADRKVRGSDPHNVAWIAGFAPVDRPRVVFVVEIEHTDLHGGEGAGPIVASFFEFLESERGMRLKLEHDRPEPDGTENRR